MNKAKEILEFKKILDQLASSAVSDKAKEKCLELEMILNQKILQEKMKETTEARRILDSLGTPPISSMQGLAQLTKSIEIGAMLEPEMLTQIASFLKGTRQMKRYLQRAEYLDCEIAFYGRGFYEIIELEEEIDRCIRNNEVDSEASPKLRSLRREIDIKREQMKSKIERIIQSKKEYLADTYIMNRNGHYVIAVKREYKSQIQGQCLDTSRTGSTIFVEPSVIGKLQEELSSLMIEESNEVRRILYVITNDVAAYLSEIKSNMEMMLTLDFAFAKGKLSAAMHANNVQITTDRHILIKQGRHPLIPVNKCVPLDFEIGLKEKGIVITGPNTGGKTVALKTIGLLSMMVQCGLHVPVQEGSVFSMHNQILCDIGDGQSIEQNLSTFSAHIAAITEILKEVTGETLVLLDELGTGTDPKEGMGIAIAILEALRQRAGLFVATTHYPEVKDYAMETSELQNACMQFDKETLMPLYTLKIGEAGESCALYIAKKLGFPSALLEIAKSYIEKDTEKSVHQETNKVFQKTDQAPVTDVNKKKQQYIMLEKSNAPKLEKQKEKPLSKGKLFNLGDSVLVFPQKEKGLVFAPVNDEGNVGVQIKGRKKWIPAKRVKLLVAASELYPSDYDYSIVFDSVANRKAIRDMKKNGYKASKSAVYKNLEEANLEILKLKQ